MRIPLAAVASCAVMFFLECRIYAALCAVPYLINGLVVRFVGCIQRIGCRVAVRLDSYERIAERISTLLFCMIYG